MTQAGPVLKSSGHAIHLTGDLREPARPLHKYVFLVTHKKLSERMRCFIGEANASRDRLESVVEALRQLLALDVFENLLKAEGFTDMPAMLADRISGRTVSVAGRKPSQSEPSGQLIGGICPEVLDLVQDCVVPARMFGVLRQVLPSRQTEIVEVMIALERVKLNTARVFILFTPQSQLADPSTPRKQLAGITSEQFAAMEGEFAELSRKFRSAAERSGSWNLELVAARGYLDRVMGNVRLVRCLAQHYPERFAQFQSILEPSSGSSSHPRQVTGRARRSDHAPACCGRNLIPTPTPKW